MSASLLAVFLAVGQPAVAGPYTRSMEDPLFFLSFLSLPILLLVGFISVIRARRQYRPRARTRQEWVFELAQSLGITLGSFGIAWFISIGMAGALSPLMGVGPVFLLFIVYFGTWLFVQRQWLTVRARIALQGRPDDEIRETLANVRWWAFWPLATLATIILVLGFLGAYSISVSMRGH